MTGNPKKTFGSRWQEVRYGAKMAELERLIGQTHAEKLSLREAFAVDSKEV